MIATESEAMSCGSDDWSVDNDYIFEDEAPSELLPSPYKSETSTQQVLCSADEHTAASDKIPGGASAPLEEAVHDACLRTPRENLTQQSDINAKIEAYEIKSSSRVGKEVDIPPQKDHQSPGGQPRAREHSRDLGSSTESMHILRVEQRMFLKVRVTLLRTGCIHLPRKVDWRVTTGKPANSGRMYYCDCRAYRNRP